MCNCICYVHTVVRFVHTFDCYVRNIADGFTRGTNNR